MNEFLPYLYSGVIGGAVMAVLTAAYLKYKSHAKLIALRRAKALIANIKAMDSNEDAAEVAARLKEEEVLADQVRAAAADLK